MQLSKGTNDPQYTRKINAPEYTVNIYLDAYSGVSPYKECMANELDIIVCFIPVA